MGKRNQENFVSSVRSALGYPSHIRRTVPDGLFPQGLSSENRRALRHIKERKKADRELLLEVLKRSAEPINLQVVVTDTVGEMADAFLHKIQKTDTEWPGPKQVCVWRHPLLDRLELLGCIEKEKIPVISSDSLAVANQGDWTPAERLAFREGVIESFVGITSAAYCVASTGTLVLKTTPDQPRMTSLVPAIHIAVITIDQILSDFKELYAMLRWGEDDGVKLPSGGLTFITGPSKTADIEATLVHGAHGPRELVLGVVNEGSMLTTA